MTKTPPIRINNISLLSNIAKHANAEPNDREPTSPIKILAGLALYQRKPMHAPTIDKQKINSSLILLAIS